ncbi:HAD family hydrolase [Longivirga aurantiaca]|uniref:HAD family hydrolase n=1 Tax=Longivirga aurantiaca TaxID=1837743 RepID=A0ABW1T4L5_9ACTN
MPTPYTLVILDCDGVLVDSERLAAEVSAEMFRALGWEVEADELRRRFSGCTPTQWQAGVRDELGDRLEQGWAEELRSRCEAAFDSRLHAVDGVSEALARIGVPMCVATNGDRATTRRNLRRVNLLERFENAVFVASDVAQPKPAPDLFLHAARSLGALPSSCAVVEDSITGVRAARAAAMDCFAYTGATQEDDALSSLGAIVFRDMRELPLLLDRGGT